MPQLDYNQYMDEGYEGLIATAEPWGIKSGAAEEDLNFGRGVVQGTSENQVKLPTADTDTFLGITVFQNKQQVNINGTLGSGYETGSAVSYLTKGVIKVPATVAVNKNQKAYLITTGGDAGKFTNVSTSNIDTGGYFQQTIGAAGLVNVELNNPQK